MFYVYILESVNGGHLYTGYTSELKRRLKEHNQRLNFYTKRHKPWKLIYYEACLNQDDAKRREKYLKKSQGMRLLKMRLKEYFYNSRKNLIN